MIKRKFYLEKIVKLIDTEDIKVITGVRRCGKTVLLKQIIDELENRGIASENIIYMSFESSKYKNIRNDNDLDEFIFSSAPMWKSENMFFNWNYKTCLTDFILKNNLISETIRYNNFSFFTKHKF